MGISAVGKTPILETKFPFRPKVLPMSQLRCETHVSGPDLVRRVGLSAFEPPTRSLEKHHNCASRLAQFVWFGTSPALSGAVEIAICNVICKRVRLSFLRDVDDSDVADIAGLQIIVSRTDQRTLHLSPALGGREVLGAIEDEIGLL